MSLPPLRRAGLRLGQPCGASARLGSQALEPVRPPSGDHSAPSGDHSAPSGSPSSPPCLSHCTSSSHISSSTSDAPKTLQRCRSREHLRSCFPQLLSVWAQKTHHSRPQVWAFLMSTAHFRVACPEPHITPIHSPTTHSSDRGGPAGSQLHASSMPAPTAPALPGASHRACSLGKPRVPGGCPQPLKAWQDLRNRTFRTCHLCQHGLLTLHLCGLCGFPAPVIFSVVGEARGP